MISLCKHAAPGEMVQLTCALSEDNLDSLQAGFALLLCGKRLDLPGCDLAFLFGKDQEAAGLRLKVLAHHLDFPEDGVLQTASFPEGQFDVVVFVGFPMPAFRGKPQTAAADATA